MITEVYHALREVGVSEKKRGVAEAVAVQEPAADLDRNSARQSRQPPDWRGGRLNFMQWQIGIIAALQIAALVKLFVH
jgi:hypothetical protein